MGRRLRAFFAVVAAVPLVALGCGGDDEPDRSLTTNACGRTADRYLAGVERKTPTVSMSLISGNGQPGQLVKGLNEITIDLEDGNGRPIQQAKTDARAFMPDLGLSSPMKPRVEAAEPSIGRYRIKRVYLQKEGLWDVAVTIEADGIPAQELAFHFCVEGGS